MANHKSAIKEHRQALVRRERNRSYRARLRTQIKVLRKAIAAGEADEARSMLSATLSLIDCTAKHGAIKANAADRAKSRLTRATNQLGA